jgi:hypothetical protein
LVFFGLARANRRTSGRIQPNSGNQFRLVSAELNAFRRKYAYTSSNGNSLGQMSWQAINPMQPKTPS